MLMVEVATLDARLRLLGVRKGLFREGVGVRKGLEWVESREGVRASSASAEWDTWVLTERPGGARVPAMVNRGSNENV